MALRPILPCWHPEVLGNQLSAPLHPPQASGWSSFHLKTSQYMLATGKAPFLKNPKTSGEARFYLLLRSCVREVSPLLERTPAPAQICPSTASPKLQEKLLLEWCHFGPRSKLVALDTHLRGLLVYLLPLYALLPE